MVSLAFVYRSIDKESLMQQGHSTQVASPMLRPNSKHMDGQSTEAGEASSYSGGAAASVSSTSSTGPGTGGSPLAEERTATYHELAKPVANGAKTSANAVALLKTKATKTHQNTTGKPKAGLDRVNTTCVLALPIRAMRTVAGSVIRMPVRAMTAGTNLSELGAPVAMRGGGSQPNPVPVDVMAGTS